MKKKFIAGVIVGGVLFGTAGALAGQYVATENPFPIQLNGDNVIIEGYNIDGSTYFKLRDIADVIGGFDVDFDNDIIKLTQDSHNQNNNSENAQNDKTQSKVPNDFTGGFELADFSKFNSYASENGLGGTKIYLDCIINEVDLTGDGKESMISGFITDNNSNKWLCFFNLNILDNINDYKDLVGEQVTLCGIYQGYSGKHLVPAISLYKLCVNDTGYIKYGQEKTKESLNLTESNTDSSENKQSKQIIQRTSQEYDFTSTSGIEHYLYENYPTLNTSCGMWQFTYIVSDYGYFSEDYNIDLKYDDFYKMKDIQTGIDYFHVDNLHYTDTDREETKEQLKAFMKEIATDLMDKIPDKKLTGSYNESHYKYPKLRMDHIISNYCTWANYDRGNNDSSLKASTFRWLPNLDGEIKY